VAATNPSLIAFCRSLPHATEDIKWGNDLCFSISGKMFAVFDQRGTSFSFKTTPGTFAVLTAKPGIVAAPYVGRYHWVLAEHPHVLPASSLKALLGESYELVVAKLPGRLKNAVAGPSASCGRKARARR
jgi:predicted DNA-binding protein (MmcQ/YjbR family)